MHELQRQASGLLKQREQQFEHERVEHAAEVQQLKVEMADILAEAERKAQQQKAEHEE